MNDKELIEALRAELLRCADVMDGAALVLGQDKQVVTAATCRERAFRARVEAGRMTGPDESERPSGRQETGQGVADDRHGALVVLPVAAGDYNGYNPLQVAYAAKVAVRRRAEELAFIAGNKNEIR